MVVPVYANESTLVELLDRVERALEGEDFELVAVVDGSPDGSLDLLRGLLPQRPGLVVVELSRNFGQHAALCAGFAVARGQVTLILDADLQQRPEDLPRFLARWREGHDFVSGRRVTRHDPLGRRFFSFCLNLLMRSVVARDLNDWGCPIAAVDRALLDEVPAHGEKRRFLKPLVAQLSRRACEVEVEAEASRGASSYSSLALIGVALDFVVSFSNRPFQKLAGLGFLAFLLGCLTGAVYIALRLAGVLPDLPVVQALGLVAVLVGLQTLILGALGEFTHRIYRLVQGHPLYEVRATHTSQTERAGPS